MTRGRGIIAGFLVGLFLLGMLVHFCSHGMMRVSLTAEIAHHNTQAMHDIFSNMCPDGACEWQAMTSVGVLPLVAVMIVAIVMVLCMTVMRDERCNADTRCFVYVPPWRSGGRFALRE